jgi:hypothetical protein
LSDNIEVLVGDDAVVGSNINIFFVMLLCKLGDSQVLLVLDLLDHLLSLVFHFSSQVHHFIFEFQVDFVRNTLKLLSKFGLFLIFLFSKSVEIFLMSHFLLFLPNLKRS